MQNLSDDFLRFIFSYLITSTVVLPPIFGDPRLSLMAVSPRWRRIILGSSNLWDTIVILPSSPVLTPGLAKIAEQWLKIHWRNDHILSVFLLQPRHLAHINRTWPRDQIQTFRIVEDGILPMARCTTSFSCTLSTNHGVNAFFTIPSRNFSCLERLELSVPMLPDQELARAIKKAITKESRRFTAFQRLPRLRTAVINIQNRIHPLAFKIPWQQLTTLDMRNTVLYPRIFLEVLSDSAPSLKHGSFTIQFKRINCQCSTASLAPKKIFRTVKLRFLQSLHLRLIDPNHNTRIFSRIHPTALLHLRIELDRGSWAMSTYQGLLSNSCKTLKSLALWDAPLQGYQSTETEGPALVYTPPCSQQNLDGLFSNLPNLEHVRVPNGVFIPPSAADRIAQGILLPSLRILEVTSTTGVDILDMVRRRNELTYLRSGWVGSSKSKRSKLDSGMAAGTSFYPPFFSDVRLLTVSRNRSKVELAKKYLQSSSSSQRTVFDIHYANFAI